jgi:hypothetical protein
MRDTTDVVTEVEVLDAEACGCAIASVHDLRRLWQRRAPVMPFYTLGVAAYLDAARRGVAAYRALARLTNPLLWARFDWLYARVAAVLAEQLGAPVRYDTSLALPGFHVFLHHQHPLAEPDAHGAPKDAARGEVSFGDAPPHVDAQWELVADVASRDPAADVPPTTSFTLALRLPTRGTGLDVWDLHAEEVRQSDQARVAALFLSRPRTFHAYRPGWLTMHSGMVFHRIAPTEFILTEDERLTLQGHGIFDGAAWRLYW